MMRTHDINI